MLTALADHILEYENWAGYDKTTALIKKSDVSDSDREAVVLVS